MLLIKGKRNARIKIFTDNHERCKNCGAFDISIAVYREYYHLFFIPFLPVGPKNAKAWCSTCGAQFGLAAMEKQYEDSTRTPIYLYSIPLLFGALIVLAIAAKMSTQKDKAAYVHNPRAGDVYLIRNDKNDTTSYYFLQVSEVKGDTVFALHNSLEYFSYTTSLAADDSFFTNEQLIFTKHKLQQMLDADEINAVLRN